MTSTALSPSPNCCPLAGGLPPGCRKAAQVHYHSVLRKHRAEHAAASLSCFASGSAGGCQLAQNPGSPFDLQLPRFGTVPALQRCRPTIQRHTPTRPALRGARPCALGAPGAKRSPQPPATASLPAVHGCAHLVVRFMQETPVAPAHVDEHAIIRHPDLHRRCSGERPARTSGPGPRAQTTLP